jgi:hypothetical protein
MDWGPVGLFTGKDGALVGNDSHRYIIYVEFFRRNVPKSELSVPYAYRPLVPFVASLMPFDPLTSIDVVNIVFLLVVLVIAYNLLCVLGFPFSYSILGCFMFAVSFPTFYYGTIGYVEPALILFLFIGVYLLVMEKWTYLVLTIVIGCLAKEAIILLIPVLLAYLLLSGHPWKLKLTVSITAYLITTLAVRVIFGGLEGPNYWQPSFHQFLANLRARALLSIALTFGVPGFLSWGLLFGCKKIASSVRRPILASFVVGLLASILLGFYSMWSVHTDGRYIWTSYPFSIPLALWSLRWLSSEKLTRLHEQVRK